MGPATPPDNTTPFAQRSLFDGLRRRAVSDKDLVAHSVAVMSPSVCALSTGFALPRIVGQGAWLSIVLGFGVAYLLALVFGEFGSRLNAPGSLYTYVAKGAGRLSALVVGVAMLFGYTAMIGFGLISAGRRADSGWEAFAGREEDPVRYLTIALGIVACLVVMRRGVRASTRVALVVESVAVVWVLIVLLVMVERHGLPSWSALSLAGADWGRIVEGAAMISLVTVAFESAAALGVEAERPFLTVPRSLRVAVLITGFVVGMATLVQTGAGGEPWHRRWLFPGSVISPGDGLLILTLGAANLTIALCTWTALSRVLFAFAREGIMPRFLGVLGPRGNPDRAALAIAPFVLAPIVLSIVRGEGPGSYSGDLLRAATAILFVAYALACVAVVIFLARLKELSLRPVLVAASALVGVVAMAVVQVEDDLDEDAHTSLILFAAVTGVGLVWWLVLLAVRRGQRIGSHNATVADEVVLTAPGGLRHD